MSATATTCAALDIVADWIDASGDDDATAFVHSTAIRDAIALIEKQAKGIADLRAEIQGGIPTYGDVTRALRDLVAVTDYRDLDKGIGIATPAGVAKLTARNLVRRLPKDGAP